MKAVAVLRKPLAGTVAQNCLTHGTGALNIDGCRVGTSKDVPASPCKTDSKVYGDGFSITTGDTPGSNPNVGRWPPHLLLTHAAACGETCADGCPVAEMDAQSGVSASGVSVRRNLPPSGASQNLHIKIKARTQPGDDFGYGDTGGASRFFRQVKRMKELHDYLTTMITPPEGEVLLVDDVEAVDWSGMEDASLHGVILSAKAASAWEGELPAEVYRVLRPGAHVLLMAADDDPTGFRGACAFEDAGFQVRDTIAVMDTPGEFQYVAKASRAEREFGLRGKRNKHPTVKPVDVMSWIIEESDEEAHVLDPFLGSGTTGMAATKEFRRFTGIELSEEYAKMAEKRIDYAIRFLSPKQVEMW